MIIATYQLELDGPDGPFGPSIKVPAVLKSDYDALAAQLAELRKHLGTLTPGGSHTCITCAAHCVAIGDMEARIAALEAALREIVTDGDYTAPESMKRIAREALGLTAETDVKRPEHATAQSVTQAQTLRSDINIPCSCGPGDCNKRILAHNEYCTEDRRAFEVEEDLLLDRRVYGTSFHKIVNGKKVRVHPLDVRIINDMPKDSSNTECIASKTEGKP